MNSMRDSVFILDIWVGGESDIPLESRGAASFPIYIKT